MRKRSRERESERKKEQAMQVIQRSVDYSNVNGKLIGSMFDL